jgi:hypothetical protein
MPDHDPPGLDGCGPGVTFPTTLAEADQDEERPLIVQPSTFRMASRTILIATVLPLLGACVSTRPAPRAAPMATETGPEREKVWARADGQRMAANPSLAAQGRRDLTECRSLAAIEGQPGQYHLPTLNDCMNQRGYVEIDKPA